jgi:2-dehydro-3-deoxyphosphogluconate aldolase / (4S)-4-hydroxy-2-oxoglutarate aldolase
MHAVLEKLGKIGIVPVIKIDDVGKAVPLARALEAGGIPCVELTFRTDQAEEAIRRISKEVPEVLTGAGTVLTTEQVDKAINAGAKYIVSPGLNPKVVSYCIKKGIPVCPGCANPSDIEQALEFGLEVVKFFPAEQAGGIEYIKAISAPYHDLKFMPTGGINAANIAKYILFDKTLACGSSWMATAELINAEDFEKITALSKEAVLGMLGFRVAHIGINSENEEDAMKGATLFNRLFGHPLKHGNSSVFTGENIEFMKTPGFGAHGHIAIKTNSLPRAIAYLERAGIAFDYESAKKDPKGNITALYLKEEVLGFALHLVSCKS